VKVLDFGLARHLDHQGVEILTQGTNAPRSGLRGTLSYMAPELLRGELADVRTDIWSLGVTTFEMLTRELPFRGNSDFELASAILSGTARELPSHINPRLRQIVRRCLAADSSLRFQSAADVHQALVGYQRQADYWWAEQIARRTRWSPTWSRFAVLTAVVVLLLAVLAWPQLSRTPRVARNAGAIALVSRAHLAVLPTRLIGTAAAEPHLGIVIPDMITTRLAASRGVRVRSTAAVTAFAHSVDPAAIGEALGVDNVLSSTLWRGAGLYRLSLQLLDTRNSVLVWAQEFTLSIEDLPRIEALVATRVVGALRLPLERPLALKPLGLTRASYDEYLQGRAMLIRHSPEALRAAVSMFDRVLKANPEFAPAHAALALVSARLYWQAGRADVHRWAERAKAAAERALSLDPSLADAHQAIAAVYRYNESDWIRTIDESRLALDLDPSLDLPHYNLAVAFYHLGLLDISKEASLAGLIANPATRYDSLLNRGRVALYSGMYRDAEALLQEAARLEGGDPPWILAEAYYYNGHSARAEALLRSMFDRGGSALNRTRAGASLAAFLAAGGRDREARQLLRQTLDLEPTDHHAVYRIGTAFAQLNDAASAVRWLRRAAESGFPCYSWFASDPLSIPLRDDASFRVLLSELRGSAEKWKAQYGSIYLSPDSAESSESRLKGTSEFPGDSLRLRRHPG
jgi:serine/threonine-protein kinase